MDWGFPIIRYDTSRKPKDWGEEHGEKFREGIRRLASIRRDLMLAKNPRLLQHLPSLALEQYETCRKYDGPLFGELEGIRRGASVTVEDIVILNNYTDFRDIDISDEGCSTVYLRTSQGALAGQTWDMHGSAKDFLCLIDIPRQGIFFSLLGCLGLMGLNSSGCFLGVNNLNTSRAQAGLIWPLLVRHALREKSVEAMGKILRDAPVTSGHNYLLASKTEGIHMEVTPSAQEEVSSLQEEGVIFHTNHCLGKETKKQERTLGVNSTSFDRYKLLEKKTPSVSSRESLVALLQDHENFPRSLCSHAGQGDHDLSHTCGGGVVDFSTQTFHCWRGCPEYDGNFKEYTL